MGPEEADLSFKHFHQVSNILWNSLVRKPNYVQHKQKHLAQLACTALKALNCFSIAGKTGNIELRWHFFKIFSVIPVETLYVNSSQNLHPELIFFLLITSNQLATLFLEPPYQQNPIPDFLPIFRVRHKKHSFLFKQLKLF